MASYLNAVKYQFNKVTKIKCKGTVTMKRHAFLIKNFQTRIKVLFLNIQKFFAKLPIIKRLDYSSYINNVIN